jgi:rhomboid protease GluP
VPISPKWQRKWDRFREQFTSIFHAKEEQKRPRLCPACGTLVGTSASRCHNCGANVNFSLAAASRSLSGLLPTESPITFSMLGLSVILFAYSLVLTMRVSTQFNLLGNIEGIVLYRLGACWPALFQTHEFWRLVMPNFLHANLFHIGFNAFALLDIGPKVEEVYGSPRYLFLYMLTGIFAFVVSAVFGHFSVGASGALCGLIGLMIGITYRRGGALNQMLRSFLFRWIFFIFIFGFFAGADHAAHGGGLVSGYILGRYVVDDREPMTPQEHKRAYLLGWSAALVIVISFVFMVRNFLRTPM